MQTNTRSTDGCAPRQRLVRGLGLFGAGATLAVGSALIAEAAIGRRGGGESPPPGPVALWATDRDGGVVYGLDANLIVARQVQLAWPVEVEACRDGGAWALRAGNGSPAGTYRLDRIARDGSLVTEVTLGTCLDLAGLDGRDALVIELGSGPGGADRALRLETEGGLHVLLEAPGLLCVADSRGSVAVGTQAGGVMRLHPAANGAVLDRVQLGGQIGDLAPGPWPGSLWALDVTGNGRLVLLDADLSIRWSAPIGLRSLHLAPVPGEERIWIADTTEPIVRRFGPGGVLELDRQGLPLTGLDRAVAWSAGGVLLAAPGAILRLDAAGALQPGQGGFAFLVDLDGVERKWP